MAVENFSERDLQILDHIETNPEVTQSTLAEQLGIAVGTVNFVVRRLIDKGYIQVKRLERKRLKYIVTPQGIAIRAKLTLISVQYSMKLYRETRRKAQSLLTLVRKQGYDTIFIEGEGDLADVVRLTCLEQNISVKKHRGNAPIIEIDGGTLLLVQKTTT